MTSSLGPKPWKPLTQALSSAAQSGGKALSRVRTPGDRSPDARRVLTIGRPLEEVRALFGDPERLGRVLAEPYTADPTPWTAEVQHVADTSVRFTARSGQEPPLGASGTVRLQPAPQDLGTEVVLELHLDAPALAAGAAAHKALRRAKALAETGEIPSTTDNPSGRHEPRPAESAGA